MAKAKHLHLDFPADSDENHPYLFRVVDESGEVYEPSDQERRAAMLLVSGYQPSEIAGFMKLPVSRVQGWNGKSYFRKLKRRMANEIYLACIGEAAAASSVALRKLKEIIMESDSDRDCLRACEILLRLGDRGQSLVYEERTNDLQRIIERDAALTTNTVNGNNPEG